MKNILRKRSNRCGDVRRKDRYASMLEEYQGFTDDIFIVAYREKELKAVNEAHDEGV